MYIKTIAFTAIFHTKSVVLYKNRILMASFPAVYCHLCRHSPGLIVEMVVLGIDSILAILLTLVYEL